jgi:hypothetical protein
MWNNSPFENAFLSRNPVQTFLEAALDFAMKHFDSAGFCPCKWLGQMGLGNLEERARKQGVDAEINN